MNKSKLKLGILADSCQVPAWAYHSLERIAHSGCAEFSLLVLNESKTADRSRFGKLLENRHRAVYDLYCVVDERLFRKEPDAFRPRDIRELLPDVPAIRARPIQEAHTDRLRPSDVERIREYGLDILVKLGFRALRGDVLTAAQYGVWGYRYGDGRIYRGGPSGFWEVVERQPETGAALCILGECRGDDRVLHRSWLPTFTYSPVRNRNTCCWASSAFLPRQIERLYRLGEGEFYAELERSREPFCLHDYICRTVPSNLLSSFIVVRMLSRILLECVKRALLMDVWYLMFDLSGNGSASLCEFSKMLPPKDRFWADPHVIQTDDGYYIFVEEYVHRAGKAHISVIEMDSSGKARNPVRVLEEGYHLSYPSVFEWQNVFYMVPESAENRTVDLYECVEFPHRWQFKMSLMEDVQALDSTLFQYKGKWWMFTGIVEHKGAFPHVELFLFFADTLFTREWTPHPLNPVVSDVKRARPAGGLIVRDGMLFRPSQDCSRIYGYGFDLNEVVRLSETEYLEKPVVSVRPHWDRKTQATHTYARAGELTVIDAFMRSPRWFQRSLA